MAIGAGKYDDQCTRIREEEEATAVLLLVVEGKRGTGSSMQVLASSVETIAAVAMIASMLDGMAAELKVDLVEVLKHQKGIGESYVSNSTGH